MALVHQMFYQGTDEAASIDADKYIEQLCRSLVRSYGADDSVELDLSVESARLDIDRATLVGLIINELVSNSLKYAFGGNGGKGKLSVSLRSDSKQFILQVQDNGSGQTAEERSSDSFGLKLVDSTIKKLKGKMTVVTDDGYSTRIEFPKTT
jgi:two-component sensor histidine kinase